jgi:mercuric reductase
MARAETEIQEGTLAAQAAERGPYGDASRGSGRDYGLIVLGSGGGAFAAAIRGRDLGRTVLMVERGTVGGTCVNVGCVPSKSLLVSSGRVTGNAGALAEAVSLKAALVDWMRQKKYLDLLPAHGIDLRQGQAELIDGHTVAVDGESVSADAIVIATGARPSVPAIPGLEQAGYLTSTTTLELTEPPGRLAVIGAGGVGLELGQMLGNFGSRVTFISRRALAPALEPEVSQTVAEILAEQGHAVLEHAQTEQFAVEDGEKVLRGHLAGGQPFEVRADEILVATGRTPNTEALGLEAAGVRTNGAGAITVDEHQRTSLPSIYAAGDVTDQPRYVYVAAAGGEAAAQNALDGGDQRLRFTHLPRVIFTSPQIAAAGLTESEGGERGFQVETSVVPLEFVPRALVNGDSRGLFKLVAERGTRRLLGVSIVADGAAEVIQAAVLAIGRRMTVDALADTWAPYLTVAEGLKLAAKAFDRDVSMLSCCA